MLVDLVQVTTSDGLRLHGALELPADDVPAAPLDAWICIHGTGSNFYAASTLGGLAPKLLAAGAAVLRANTRGHDIICTGPSAFGRGWQGAAFERVDAAPLDLSAWLEFLGQRGFRRIGLLGHSLGAIKVILQMATAGDDRVAAVVAISPPRLSHSHFSSAPRGAQFRETFAMAQQLERDGRGDELIYITFPLPVYVSAAGYLDRYGPEEKYNVLAHVERVACPLLVTFGSLEVQQNDAFRGLPEDLQQVATPANSLQVAVVAGADHIYTGCHDSLAAVIAKWAKAKASGA